MGVLGNMAKFAVIPGAASEAAGEATAGTGIEPWARFLAGAGAGVGSDLAATGFGAAARAGKNFVRPFSQEGQQDIAATKLQGAFTDPDAARAELAKAAALQVPGAGLGEIVPGSRPTTGQLTGDLGALSLERELATKQPDLAKSNLFGTGSQQQNAARTTALDAIQPTGAPEAVGNTVRQQWRRSRPATMLRWRARRQTLRTRRRGSGPAQRRKMSGPISEPRCKGPGTPPRRKSAALWGAVDPDGTLALPASPVSSAAGDIVSSMPKTAKPMSGEEAAIFDTASNLPSVTPFSEITALRSRISSAMREEMRSAGSTPTYARLGQLRGSVEDAITNAATHKAASDQAAVAAGEMTPSDALGARIQGLANEGSGLPSSGQDIGAGVAENGAGNPSSGPTQNRAAGQGTGRPGNNPSGQAIPGNVTGDSPQAVLGPGTVYHPGGSLDVNYEVANLPSLITSHDADFRVNPRYPAQLQPRARDSAPARDQVNSMAARLQPERLGRSPEANSGAPIVGPDNVVESGNGRTLALGKAYSSARAGDYRNWLQSQGIDTGSTQKPILIARRVTPLAPEDRVAFTHGANTSSGLRMNAAEQAAADARLITPDGLASIADGSPVNSAENRTFVRSFLSQLPTSERGGMLDAAGNLSQAGVRRLQAAMASRAYGDGEFVARAFDAADPNIRGLAGGMTDASGAWMKMRQAAREGAIDPEHDVTPDLMNAARAVMRARAAGRPVSEVLNQGDMFGGETSALAKRLILNDKGNLASRDQISARLQKYAGEAQKNLAGPGLFGDTVSPAQVLKTSLGDAGKTVAQEAPLASAAMKPAPVANLDAAAAARMQTASAATKARVSTFDSGPVGAALRKAGNSTDYKMAELAGSWPILEAGTERGGERAGVSRGGGGERSSEHEPPPRRGGGKPSQRGDERRDDRSWQVRGVAEEIRERAARTASRSQGQVRERGFGLGCCRGGGGSPQGRHRRVSEKRRGQVPETQRPRGYHQDDQRHFRGEGRRSADVDAGETGQGQSRCRGGPAQGSRRRDNGEGEGNDRKRDIGDRQPESVRLEEVPPRQCGCDQSCGVLRSRVRLDAGRRPRPATRATDARGDATAGPIQHGSGRHQEH